MSANEMGRIIEGRDIRSLMLCIAGAWLYGSISRGRAIELAKALGKSAKDMEDLKFVEERNKERELPDGLIGEVSP